MSTTMAQMPSARTTTLAPARRELFGWMKELVRIYRRSWERRAAVTSLRTLDAHLLKDIGIDRSEIVSVVYGKADATRRGRS